MENPSAINPSSSSGTLFLVSTPIGNLEDITARALRILGEVDLVAAEDTRRTVQLLTHFGLKKSMISYHDFNKERRTPELIRLLQEGKNIAVVSDAGTPGISDPAFVLVRSAAALSIPVVPVPGASALIAALTVSALPTDRFVFEGFLPVKKGRRSRLTQMAGEPRTIVLFEAPHRLIRTLVDLKESLGDRPIAVCRELTKKFEEVVRGSISEMHAHFSKVPIRGEFVLVIQGEKSQNGRKKRESI